MDEYVQAGGGARRPSGWLAGNTNTFQEPPGASGGRPEAVAPLGREASPVSLLAAQATPPVPSGKRERTAAKRERTTGVLLAAIVVAGTVGGAAGSAVTAVTLGRGNIIPQAVVAGPALIGENPTATDPGSLTAIYKQVGPSVVSVQTAGPGRSTRPATPRTPGAPGSQNTPPLVPNGQGTGFDIDGAGHIITNYHVVEGATRVSVLLHDGSRVSAEVLGRAPDADLALLKADLPTGKVAVASLADSDAIEPGDLAMAIGTPFGLDHTLTAGIISAINRDFGQAAGRPQRGLIQTDAAINPGNSGGPLFNAAGEVIGVTTAIESPVRANVGVGFAIPSNTVKRLLPRLLAGQTVQHAWLGISGVPLDAEVARDAGLAGDITQGVLLATVAPESPAGRAGLRGGTPGEGTTPGALARGGDVLLAVDGRAIPRVQDLSAFLDTKAPGDVVTLSIWRNGARQEVQATLAPWPAGER